VIVDRRSLRRLPTEKEQIDKCVSKYAIAAIRVIFEVFEGLQLLAVS
jgi:hypothetical protein